MITQDKLVELLREQEVNVMFTKKNGTLRDMRCTLKTNLIPEDHRLVTKKDGVGGFEDLGVKPVKSRSKSPDNIAVYDLDVNGWRSFNYSSVVDVNFQVSGIDPLTASIGGILIVSGIVYTLSVLGV